MSLSSKWSLIERLRRGKRARQKLVESHVAKGISFQIRATREAMEMTQEALAKEAGMNQNAIYRLESPSYGRPTLTTLKRIAAAMDVALVVRLVPYSELVDWISGTPRLNRGLTTQSLAVPSFSAEEKVGVFDEYRGREHRPRNPSGYTSLDKLDFDELRPHAIKAGLDRPRRMEPSETSAAAMTQ